MRKIFMGAVIVTLVAAMPYVSGHGSESKKDEPKKVEIPKPTSKVQDLMKAKLEQSQKILEGIALNDFEKIAKHAEELIQISKKVEWRVLRTPQYEMHSNEFRRNADTLVQNANKKNLDAAALSYVELTLNCVRCHKYIREVRMARLDD
jgi:hypothetical protein